MDEKKRDTPESLLNIWNDMDSVEECSNVLCEICQSEECGKNPEGVLVAIKALAEEIRVCTGDTIDHLGELFPDTRWVVAGDDQVKISKRALRHH